MPTEAVVTATTLAAKVAFAENFGLITGMVIGIVAPVVMVVMAVNWYRRAVGSEDIVDRLDHDDPNDLRNYPDDYDAYEDDWRR